MSILRRPPSDEFTLRLFFKLTSRLKIPHDKIYIWSAVLDPAYNFGYSKGDEWEIETELKYRKLLIENIKSDVVVIGIKDHLTSGDFNYWSDEFPVMVEYLRDLFQYYNNKKFILFTSVEYLEYYIKFPNVKIIPWGGDITNQQREYSKLPPILEKNLDSNVTFLSLNRNNRAHRAMLVSLLHSLDIQDSGIISCMFRDQIDDVIDYTKWKVNNTLQYCQGWHTLANSTSLLNDTPEIYHNGNNDNVSNFKNSLKKYYENTFVEIISETSYTESCYNLTEKTLNSIYGCNFPILLCSKGSVEFLRSMGLDMFDDIVDHSYDEIEEPAERLECAILKNLELLTNNERTKALWLENKSRFEKNIDFCKERMYNYYSNRASACFDEVINEYKL